MAVRIVTATILVVLAAALTLVNLPSRTNCSLEAPADPSKQWFRARNIVVQPWWGPHHVYGIFSVPLRFNRDRLYAARLVIQGLTEEFTDETPEGEDISSRTADPGHYIKRMYLPTRTALFLLLTGRFGDLRMSCHWWLVIAERLQ